MEAFRLVGIRAHNLRAEEPPQRPVEVEAMAAGRYSKEILRAMMEKVPHLLELAAPGTVISRPPADVAEEHRREKIAFEVKRADKELKMASAARASALHERESVTHCYYSGFHNVRALLLTLGLDVYEHVRAFHLVHAHFVLPGRLDRQRVWAVEQAERDREDVNFDAAEVIDNPRYWRLTLEKIDETLQEASWFTEETRRLLKEDGYL